MSDDLQKKYMEFQILQQQVQQMQQQLALVENQVTQLSSLRDALESLQSTPAKRDMLVPLGAGVFVKASLVDSKEVVMNVCAKVSVVKSVVEAQVVVVKQVSEMQLFMDELQKGMQQFAVRQGELQMELQDAAQQEKKAKAKK